MPSRREQSGDLNGKGSSDGCGSGRDRRLLMAGGAAILFVLVVGTAGARSGTNASRGAPLTIKPPASVPLNTNYDVPVTWSWRCAAGSVPPPWVLTIRWEVAPAYKGGPLVTGGKPPFKFSRGSRAFSLKVRNACDAGQGVSVRKRLSKDVTLIVTIGGAVQSGGGLTVEQRGGFRNHDPSLGPVGEAQAFHLGLTIRQGTRTLLDTKLCSYSQTGFSLVEPGVLCWS